MLLSALHHTRHGGRGPSGALRLTPLIPRPRPKGQLRVSILIPLSLPGSAPPRRRATPLGSLALLLLHVAHP